MQKAYSRIIWHNKPDTRSPINESNLNSMDIGLDTIDDRVITLDTTKANQTDLLTCVASITFNQSTGILTITLQNGTSTTIDTGLSKLAVNFDYDDDPTSPHYQQLVLEMKDGTYKYIDLSALINQFEFDNTTTVAFTVNSQTGHISAIVPDGSITEAKLQTNFLADCRTERAQAQAARIGAETSEDNAEAWAVGQKDGVDVPSTDPTYQNNSKYYAQQASTSATNAGSSASAAATSASNASTSENNAASSESNASDSASNAADSASSASGSASAAANSASAAANSASSASTNASRAETAADDASDYKEDAEAWANGEINGTPVPSTHPAYDNNSKYWKEQTEGMAETSEAWANGEIDGVPVPSTHPAYHNNAKYYKDQAASTTFKALTDVNTDQDFEGIDIEGIEEGQTVIYDSTEKKLIPGDSAGYFKDLKDTNIVTPQDGQIPLYNGTDSKWENGDELKLIYEFYGSKNLVSFPYFDENDNFFTVSKDGSVIANGNLEYDRNFLYVLESDLSPLKSNEFDLHSIGNDFNYILSLEYESLSVLNPSRIDIIDVTIECTDDQPLRTIHMNTSDTDTRVSSDGTYMEKTIVCYGNDVHVSKIRLSYGELSASDNENAKLKLMLKKVGVNSKTFVRGAKNNTQLNDELNSFKIETKSSISDLEDAVSALDNPIHNVLPVPYADKTKTENGITWTVETNGNIKASGTATDDTTFYCIKDGNPKVVWPISDNTFDIDFYTTNLATLLLYGCTITIQYVTGSMVGRTVVLDSTNTSFHGSWSSLNVIHNIYITVPSGATLPGGRFPTRFSLILVPSSMKATDEMYYPYIMSLPEITKKFNVKDLNDTIISNPQEGQVLGFDANGNIINTNSSGSGHTILDQNGNEMTTRSDLQFDGYLQTTDDSEDGATVVSDAPTSVTWSVWQTMTSAQKAGKKWLITDAPGADGEVEIETMHLAWENPSPTSTFASQQITLDTSTCPDYDYLKIYYFVSVSDQASLKSIEIPKGKGAYLDTGASSNGTVVLVRTMAYNSDTKLTFGAGYEARAASSTTNNNASVPYKIYIGKYTQTAKVTAIAANVSTLASNCMMSDEQTSVQDMVTTDGLHNVTPTSNVTIVEYFNYFKIGKLVVVNIGGVSESTGLTAIKIGEGLPVMRSRALAVIANDSAPSTYSCVAFGSVGYTELYLSTHTANIVYYGQLVYYTD